MTPEQELELLSLEREKALSQTQNAAPPTQTKPWDINLFSPENKNIIPGLMNEAGNSINTVKNIAKSTPQFLADLFKQAQQKVQSSVSEDLQHPIKNTLLGIPQGLLRGTVGAAEMLPNLALAALSPMENYNDLKRIPQIPNPIPEPTGAVGKLASLAGFIKGPSVIQDTQGVIDKWLVKNYAGKASEKMGNLIANKPELIFNPATSFAKVTSTGEPIPMNNAPSLFQQTYHEARTAFNGVKTEAGKDVGAFKMLAKNDSTLVTNANDLSVEARNIADGTFGKPSDSGIKFLNDIADRMDELNQTKKVTKLLSKPGNVLEPTQVTTTKIPDNLTFDQSQKILDSIRGSDIYHKITEPGYNMDATELKGMKIVKALQDRVNGLVDTMETKLQGQGYPIVRGRYASIMRLQPELGDGSPQAFGKTILKAGTIGNEDLLDSLQKVLPTDVFDKSIGTVGNLTKKQQEAMFGISHTGGLYSLWHLGLKKLEEPFSKIAAGSIGGTPSYPLSRGSAIMKNTGQAKKTIGELFNPVGVFR